MSKNDDLLQDAYAPPRRSKTTILKFIVMGVVIFGLGWVVGSNRLQFTKQGLNYNAAAVPDHNPTKDNQSLPADLDYASVERVYDTLRTSYDGKLDQEKLMEGMKMGLAKASGDPYTEFFTKKDAESFDEQLNGSFVGIGAELGKDDRDNLIIVSPIAGFPAEKAGLRPRDIIVKIDGTSTADMRVDDAVSRIRGEEGTVVKLDIISGNEGRTVEITRQKITIPSVTHKTLDGNIGYLQISRFAEDTPKLAEDAANEFKKANVKGVVLDMRGNPGGLLDGAVNVSSLWLNDGKTVLLEKRGGKVIETFKASGDNPLKGVPTIVLIDDGSASASEITAGALKDNGAAKLVGIKSFGKGSVQELQPLTSVLLGNDKNAAGVLKVTIARWYTPADKNIDKEGIKPDVEVQRSVDDIKAGRDPQLDKAKELLQ